MGTVYLAGPISGCTPADCFDWRQHAITSLEEWGHIGLSPARFKPFLREVKTIENIEQEGKIKNPPVEAPTLTARDRRDVATCDVVLMNLLPYSSRISIGTMIEVGWADAARKPLIVVASPGSLYVQHPMLRAIAASMLHDLDQAIRLVCTFLTPYEWCAPIRCTCGTRSAI